MAKKKCQLGPTSKERDKRFLDGGLGTLPKVVEAYLGEAAWPVEPTRGRTAQPPGVLAHCGDIVAYGLGCYSVASATR